MVLDKLWETGICAYNIMWDQNCNDIDQNIIADQSCNFMGIH